MSSYTEDVMARIKQLFESSGMSLEAFGSKMGRKAGTARRAAWQFLNSTTDPRLSMVEKACAALGVSVARLLQEPPQIPKSDQKIREAIAAIYESVAGEILDGRVSNYKAVSNISKGTDAVLAELPLDDRKRWDQWRLRTGQEIHSGHKTSAAYAAVLLNIAERLRHLPQ